MEKNAKKRSEEELKEILRQIQSKLPEGYQVTNKKPVQKEVRHLQSISIDIYWSSWVKKEGDKKASLALYDGKKIKIVAPDELKRDYEVHSI